MRKSQLFLFVATFPCKENMVDVEHFDCANLHMSECFCQTNQNEVLMHQVLYAVDRVIIRSDRVILRSDESSWIF
jgi:hypothetical protein